MIDTNAALDALLKTSIEALIRGDEKRLFSYLKAASKDYSLQNTKVVSHCYHLEFDGNGRPRLDDFIEFIATQLVNYSIPPSEIEKAKKFYDDYKSTEKFSELERKARQLFTSLKNTGEGGEILLYILVENILKIPQLLCKMPLKTNPQMHYHGVDGVYGHFDSSTDMLALYWGESKMYKNVKQGIEQCFNSLKEYLLNAHSSASPQERDIQLLKDNLDLNDEKLETALASYFDKSDMNFNKVNYRGICLVGYDHDKYPKKPNELTSLDFTKILKSEMDSLNQNISEELQKHVDLDSFHIHVFLIPFASVEEFRSKFLSSIGLV